MILSYFDAEHPARDGRDRIPEDEKVARLAAKIIIGEDDLIWHAENQGIHVPEPNKSARINARRRVGMGYWVEVRATDVFFGEVRAFSQRLLEVGFRCPG